jgi:DNA-binding transcriptional MerR regulator
MKIGELANRTGLAPSRIRFYESIGLLKTVERRPNGYRAYPADAVFVLDMIGAAQNAGFSLDEIRALMPPDLAQWERGALLEALRRKVADIEALEGRLARSKAHLTGLIQDIETKPDNIDCATNARRALSRIRGGGESTGKASGEATLARASRRGLIGAG